MSFIDKQVYIQCIFTALKKLYLGTHSKTESDVYTFSSVPIPAGNCMLSTITVAL